MLVKNMNEVCWDVECSKAGKCQCLGPSGTDPPRQVRKRNVAVCAPEGRGADPRSFFKHEHKKDTQSKINWRELTSSSVRAASMV